MYNKRSGERFDEAVSKEKGFCAIMEYQILLMEQKNEIHKMVRDYFVENSRGIMQIDFAENGEKGLDRMEEKQYDLVLLDTRLPQLSGFQVLRKIRKQSSCPVIFLMEGGSRERILEAYELGVDDYVLKPFHVAELFAKTNALFKRCKGIRLNEKMVCGRIALSPDTMEVSVDDRAVYLPNKEYLMLKTFMEQPGRVFSREQLLMSAWGYDYVGEKRVIDNHIKKLRTLLDHAGRQICTVNGRGYRLTDQS
ncbi:MAG: response regulator transcription factor [Lachnospiraceae bacterium]|nr:response regulator transcription factor [Lachnospiraceae bacterium]